METRPESASPALLGLLALTAGATVANIYYCQPLLDALAKEFHATAGRATAVAAATQIGLAIGFLLLVPLGDSFERKRLIVALTALSAAALAGVALSPSIGWMTAASFALGLICVTPHLVVPYAAGAVPPERRGRTVGTVMSGLLVGILLSRAASGAVGERVGWRAVYWLAAAAMLGLAGLLAAVLPPQHPSARVPYRELHGTLWPLARAEPVLRRHALIGALGMGAFSAFWTTLTFHLARLPGHYGSTAAGLFGLVGAVGALAAAVSGRLAETVGARPLNGAALALIVLAFVWMDLAGPSLLALALGVLVMDAGVQASHISNQTRVYALDPAKRNRLNAIYMVSYFAGGATGSALGSAAWEQVGWPGVCAVGALLGAAGLAVLFGARRTAA